MPPPWFERQGKDSNDKPVGAASSKSKSTTSCRCCCFSEKDWAKKKEAAPKSAERDTTVSMIVIPKLEEIVDMFFQNIYSEKSKFGKLIIMVLL
jgi:hypothetical protein